MFKNEKLNRIVDFIGIIILFGLFSFFYFPSSSDGAVMRIFYIVVGLGYVGTIIYKAYKLRHYETTNE